MGKTQLRTANSATSLSLRELKQQAKGWLLDGEIRQLSDNTIQNSYFLMSKLVWFLRHEEYDECGTAEIKHFLAYITNGHKETGGRWDNPHLTNKVRPRTVSTYFTNLRTFFRYVVSEGALAESPIENIRPPVFRHDQVQPFATEQVEALLAAAKKSTAPLRNEAIILFLLDTGVRASELCHLKMHDLDIDGRRCKVLGKGNKHRSVFFGKATTKALWNYLRDEPCDDDDPLFTANRGTRSGEALTRCGLLRLIVRLGKTAGIQSTRCSPHTFRHTFAVEFLRGGGNVFSLKELLGHTSLTIVNRYVSLAQADIENQHRQFSPGDRLREIGKRRR